MRADANHMGEEAVPHSGQYYSRWRRHAALSFLSAIFVGFASPAAIGCAFHNTIPETKLEGMYPGSLSVAVALRRAADSGVLDASALSEPHNVAALYLKTMPRLRAFGKFLAASPMAAELPASFALGYVESGLWTRFSQTDGEVRVDMHTDGPAEGEAVLLTGEPLLTEVLAGRLSVDRAPGKWHDPHRRNRA
jgi:hypothetical protein